MGLIFGSRILKSVVVDVVDELQCVAIEGPTLAFNLVLPFEVVCGDFELGEVDQGVLEGKFFFVFTSGDIIVFEEKVNRSVDLQELIEFRQALDTRP